MAKTRAEVIDGKIVTIVEDSREDLNDFLEQAQEIDALEGKAREDKINEVFGAENQEEEQPELTAEQKEARDNREKQMTDKTEASRANSDVALAMMISDKAASTIPENPCYVVHGAKAICSMGSREARLVVPLDHGTLLTNSPQMIVEDYYGLDNVKCFGNCFSAENPNMEQVAIEATNRYNQEKSETLWGKVKGFFGVKPKVVDSVSEELEEACICECTPEFSKAWNDGNRTCKIEGKRTLIQICTLVCKYGGIVRIIDNGQEQ